MGYRYYCEYCDKLFIDDLDSRKRHLQSSTHQRLRDEHYRSFEDPIVILKSESEKIACSRFFNDGYCPYASQCKYTHYTRAQLYEIKLRIQEEAHLRKIRAQTTLDPLKLETWLSSHANSLKPPQKSTNSEVPSTTATSSNSLLVHTFWNYPEEFRLKPGLPPSLRQFAVEHFTDSVFPQWGE